MNDHLVIRIKRRSQPQWLTWLSVLFPFLFGVLIEILGLPWAVRYVLDVVWILLLLLLIGDGKQTGKQTRGLVVWTVAFLIYTFINYLLQYQSGLYYLWGVRNNFRAYVIFFASAAFMTMEDSENLLKFMDKLFWLNFVLTLFQYFVLGLSGDFLGGIFGSIVGANGFTNIFCTIVFTKSLVRYLEKKEGTVKCAAQCAAALLVAVLAELKFFFVEVLMIIAMAVLLTNFTWRKFWVVMGGILAVFAGAFTVSILFPDFAGWYSLEWIIEVATSEKGYTYAGDMNRLSAIPMINDLWLHTGTERMFGLGLGNCDTASFAALNTPFYDRYGHMHYSWFSYASIYLECGWIGLLFYGGFFALLYLRINKIRKNCSEAKRTYCRIAMILSVVCMMLLIYNSSLRMEAANMMCFALAVPFMQEEQNYTIDNRKEVYVDG